jgi:hypothetical protein
MDEDETTLYTIRCDVEGYEEFIIIAYVNEDKLSHEHLDIDDMRAFKRFLRQITPDDLREDRKEYYNSRLIYKENNIWVDFLYLGVRYYYARMELTKNKKPIPFVKLQLIYSLIEDIVPATQQ